MKGLTTVLSHDLGGLEVPGDVAKCPICDAPILISEIQEWESESGRITGLSIDCTTEPDMDGPDWWDWHRGHWSMPYVDWLPVEQTVLGWANRTYRIGEPDS